MDDRHAAPDGRSDRRSGHTDGRSDGRSDAGRPPDPVDAAAASSARNTALVALLLGAAACSLIEIAAAGVPVGWRLAGAAAIGLAVAGFTRALVANPLLAQLRSELARSEAAGRRHEVAITRHRLLHRTVDALAIADDEGDALSAAASAVREALPATHDLALLLCSTSDSSVAWSAAVDAGGVAAPIPHEGDGRCIAAVRHHTTTASSLSRFDACPHVTTPSNDGAPGDTEPGSSVCVPILKRGATTAVLHVAGPEGAPPDRGTIALIEEIATMTGRRIAELAPPPTPGTTIAIDPLTGLPNHRAAIAAIKELIGGLTPFSLAVCDLDALGAYNDEHGTEVGDRALQLFAEALRGTLRPGDVVVRWGDDEFMAVFPRCSSPNAQAAMERVREALVLATAEEEMAPFTCSTGVVDSNQGTSIDELLETADLALSVAKNEGGNRVRTAVF